MGFLPELNNRGWGFIKQNRKAIQFLLLFGGSYFILNSAYRAFIHLYFPVSDPFTHWVSAQVVWFLSLFDYSVTMYPSQFAKYIAVANDYKNMIYVYEGCNGLKEMIVYLSFLVAFTRPGKFSIQFAALGLVSIHLFNVGRLSLLYGVSFYFPERFNFFYKYLFPGITFALVFVLWFFLIRKVRDEINPTKVDDETSS